MLVEPLATVKDVALWRPNDLIYNVAISPTEGRCRMLQKPHTMMSLLESSPNAEDKGGDKVIDVKCVKLQTLFDRHGITELNYLSIDVGVRILC